MTEGEPRKYTAMTWEELAKLGEELGLEEDGGRFGLARAIEGGPGDEVGLGQIFAVLVEIRDLMRGLAAK